MTTQEQGGSTPGQGSWNRGPLGYGSGPLVAAGVMAAGAVVLGGVGFASLAGAEGGLQGALAKDKDVPVTGGPVTPGGPGTPGVSPTIPDSSADPEDSGQNPEDPVSSPEEPGASSSPGTGPDDEGDQGEGGENGGGTGGSTEPADPGTAAQWGGMSETTTYIIKTGDTLSKISGETGVPIGHLVEANKIADPNLIYADAALIIPVLD